MAEWSTVDPVTCHVTTWKCFQNYRPFVRGIRRWRMDSSRKEPVMSIYFFSLMLTCTRVVVVWYAMAFMFCHCGGTCSWFLTLWFFRSYHTSLTGLIDLSSISIRVASAALGKWCDCTNLSETTLTVMGKLNGLTPQQTKQNAKRTTHRSYILGMYWVQSYEMSHLLQIFSITLHVVAWVTLIKW